MRRRWYLFMALGLLVAAAVIVAVLIAAGGSADARIVDEINRKIEAGEMMTAAEIEAMFGEPPNAPATWSLTRSVGLPGGSWRGWEKAHGAAIVWFDRNGVAVEGVYIAHDPAGLFARLRRW